jgi:hypothetical protein
MCHNVEMPLLAEDEDENSAPNNPKGDIQAASTLAWISLSARMDSFEIFHKKSWQ